MNVQLSIKERLAKAIILIVAKILGIEKILKKIESGVVTNEADFCACLGFLLFVSSFFALFFDDLNIKEINSDC